MRTMNLLVKTQQYMLKREGCYEGAIDGVWNDECREGMKLWLDNGKPEQIRGVVVPENYSFFLQNNRLPYGWIWWTVHGQRCVVPWEDRQLNKDFYHQEEIEEMLAVIEGKKTCTVVVRDAKTMKSAKAGMFMASDMSRTIIHTSNTMKEAGFL